MLKLTCRSVVVAHRPPLLLYRGATAWLRRPGASAPAGISIAHIALLNFGVSYWRNYGRASLDLRLTDKVWF